MPGFAGTGASKPPGEPQSLRDREADKVDSTEGNSRHNYHQSRSRIGSTEPESPPTVAHSAASANDASQSRDARCPPPFVRFSASFGGTASHRHLPARPYWARNRSTWSKTSNSRDPFLIRAAWGMPAGMKYASPLR